MVFQIGGRKKNTVGQSFYRLESTIVDGVFASSEEKEVLHEELVYGHHDDVTPHCWAYDTVSSAGRRGRRK
jgi:hypothetical protein